MRSTRNRFSRKGGGKKYRIRRQGLGKNQGSAINPVSVLVKPSDRPCIIIKGSRGTDDAFCSRGQLNIHVGANLITSKLDIIIEIISLIVLQYPVLLIIGDRKSTRLNSSP